MPQGAMADVGSSWAARAKAWKLSNWLKLQPSSRPCKHMCLMHHQPLRTA